MNSKPVALIRTDGNAQIGYGHVMRMLALANMISFDFDIVFLMKGTDGWIKEQVENQFEIIEISGDKDFSWCNQIPERSKIIVLDGYQFDTQYQDSLKKALDIPLISIDDFQPFPYVTEAVINHAGNIDFEEFSLSSNTKLFTGTQYALLRSAYNNAAKENPRQIMTVKSVFISLGGTDPDYYNEIIARLQKFKINKFFIVVNKIEKFESLKNIDGVELYSNLDATSMIELMKKSDIAVLPASTLSYEYCSVKGGIFVIQTAENQKNIFNFLIKSGCAFDFQKIEEVFKQDVVSIINKQIEIQKSFFKGENEEQLRKLVFKTAFERKYRLRKATNEDLMLFFEWANDPLTRNNSFNKDFISLETHTSWFEKILKRETSALYVLTADELCLGSIRFDVEGKSALLSYSIDKNYRGKSLGTIILKLGIIQISKDFPNLEMISGYINIKNMASISSFLKVGFLLNAHPQITYPEFNYYTYTCK